jgi:hypothetical protein
MRGSAKRAAVRQEYARLRVPRGLFTVADKHSISAIDEITQVGELQLKNDDGKE